MNGYQVTIKVLPSVISGEIGHAFLTLSAPGKPDITVGYYPAATAPINPGVLRNDAVTGVDQRTGVPAEHSSWWTKTFEWNNRGQTTVFDTMPIAFH